MSYKVIKTTSHQQWLDERKKGVGSSEAGTIMGVNHFDTPYKLWRRKTGIDLPVEQNEAMEMGHHLEPAVATLFAARTGAIIKKSSEGDWLAVDTKREYLRVSPDRLYHYPGEKPTKSNQHILECKTTSVAVDKDDIPVYWYCQLQYQMGVMGVKKGAVAWISSYPRLNFDYKEIDFNPDFYKAMIDAIEQFWLINVKGGIAPEDIDGEDSLLRSPQATAGETLEADSEMMERYDAIKEIASTIKKLENTRTSLEDEIKIALGTAESLVSPEGSVIAQWKNTKDTRKFNAKAFQAAEPTMYNLYMETVPGSRRFTIR